MTLFEKEVEKRNKEKPETDAGSGKPFERVGGPMGVGGLPLRSGRRLPVVRGG